MLSQPSLSCCCQHIAVRVMARFHACRVTAQTALTTMFGMAADMPSRQSAEWLARRLLSPTEFVRHSYGARASLAAVAQLERFSPPILSHMRGRDCLIAGVYEQH